MYILLDIKHNGHVSLENPCMFSISGP